MARTLFITLFMARSGSKFLRSLLNQHPDIYDYGEVFHNRENSFSEEVTVLDKLSEVLLSPHPKSGFQFRYPRHFREFPEIPKLLGQNNTTIKAILLKRRNKLKGAISQQNAEQLKATTGKAHLFKSSKVQSVEKLHLDIPRAVTEAIDRERLDEQYLKWARQFFQVHEVYYEDLCEDQERVVNGICRFLDVRPFKSGTITSSDLVKVTSNDLETAIANYNDLSSAVKSAGRNAWLGKPQIEIIQSKIKEVIKMSAKTRSGKDFSLTAETYTLKTNTKFIEHVNAQAPAGAQLIASQEENIFHSIDGGRTWSVIPVGESFRKCFTTQNGTHLLLKESGAIFRYSASWKLLDIVETGQYPWHGSWSIDQDPETGTIIWCEYPYSASSIRVWRSEDDGASWTPCFTQSGDPDDPKAGSIRHFHLVQKCSTFPKRWYLSSGDTAKQSRLWVSNDDGLNWEQIPISNVINKPEEIDENDFGRLHRFTAIVQTEDELIWATDDTFKKTGARVCSVDKDHLGTIKVFRGDCGINEMRNLIQLNDQYALAVSESKLDLEAVYITLIDFVNKTIEATIKLENKQQLKSNFMNGISSRSADGNIFYSQTDNKILRPSPMTTRWKFEII